MFDHVVGAAAPETTGRISAARAALAKAELAAGLRTRLTGPGLGGATEGIALPAGLDALFPGGLVPGSVVSVRGSASLLHTLVAASMGEAGWAAVIGGKDIGWVAAAEAGVDLARVVSIPQPGPAAADVVAACVDGFATVLLGAVDLGAGATRSLAGRVRSNGAVLLTTRPWHGAPVLRARVRGAEIGPDGLTERTITVQREGSPATVVVRMSSVARAAHLPTAEPTFRHLRAVS
ncbi:MAG: hypothetical protein Q4G64_01340 [bacterium]|nr:hypothetical protein [bacterium]